MAREFTDRETSSETSRDFAGRAPRRAKPSRKSQWKKPPRILGVWARMALLLCFLGVLVFLAVALVSKAVRPYREARGQSAQLAQTQAENSAVAAQNALITRHIAYLKTNDGVASEARKMGYLRPGEIPIVVEGLTTPGSQPMPDAAPSSVLFPSTPAAPDHAAHSSAAQRFWRHLTGH